MEAIFDDLPIPADDVDASGIYHETVMRFLALRLSSSDLRDKDIHEICGVSDYFLGSMAKDRASAGQRRLTRAGHARHGKRAPGIWSLCRTRKLRLEAAMFIVDWIVADQPFTTRPSPIALDRVYRRYQYWYWRDEERTLLSLSACLAIICNIRSGKLLLNRCLMCDRLSIEAALQADGSGCGDINCSFCDSPHKTPCQFTPDHRVLEPA